jgi:phage terminase large subunit
LPPDFVQSISAGKPEWWVKRYVDGSFEHAEGMVYPNISSAIIPTQKVNDQWERAVALDHGLRNPTACLVAAIDEQKGEVHIFKEYYVAGRLVPEHAKHLKEMLTESKVAAGNTRFMVIDPSAKNTTDPINGKNVQALYQEYGLYFQPANNAIEAGILKVNSYIERGKLKIHDTCANLIREMQNYKFPEQSMDVDNKNLKENPIKANDHACDALRYLLMRLPDDPDNLKTSSHKPPDRYIMEEDEDGYGKKGDFLSYI